MAGSSAPDYSFNLLDQPWVPCTRAESRRAVVLSLREVLMQAAEIREIADPSPLVAVALHRLLLAILHRSLEGPRDSDQWAEWWEAQTLPLDRVQAYLATWQHRFDLFDADRPFYQTTEVDPSYAVPVGKLTFERGVFTGDELFTHEVRALDPGAAARALMAHQAFALGGTGSFQSHHGEDAATYKYAAAAPTAKGALVLMRGATLLQTLLLNMVRYSHADGAPFPAKAAEAPAWERGTPARVETRPPDGYTDYLTWQSRRIRLLPTRATISGHLKVATCVVMKGVQLPPTAVRRDYETMMAFTARAKAKDDEDPWMAVVLSREQAMWRNSLALFQSVKDVQSRPRVVDWVASLSRDVVSPAATYRLDVFGMDSKQMQIFLWRREQLPLPLEYLDNPDLVGALRKALRLADDGHAALHHAAWRLADLALAPASDHDGMPADRGAVGRLTDGVANESAYWAALERPFTELLVGLADDHREDAGVLVYGGETLPRWIETIRSAARSALNPSLDALGQGARTCKAAALAEIELGIRLGWLHETEAERAARIERRDQAVERNRQQRQREMVA